ncbi:LOW QUALITY PROTEIN: Retrotransposon nucleocapsid protein, related [Eimeria mitis]|uniref:Retrotransposon nucleocapsid protein, related n=1 Tax=Eimeria mitis TaxID=44415 RepID=U6KDS4_9EIME|nr:LOW QUALITY PROTEIN: Retrotransposon nucleocapsid protein, related [Eimeria mitis]CDJ36185.1 Retrotransposon nucleocapsid protein, related [Eimeria mitis]
MAHFIPTKKSASTADTIELLADRLFRYLGFPDVLISDRDPRFQSQLWQQLCHRFHIKDAMSSPYHPQSDGQTERVSRTLEQMLSTYIQTDEREWERLLPALELAYNTTSHSSTELSPFEVMIGQNPVTAADLDVIGNLAPTLTPPMTKLFQQLCDRAQSHILKAKPPMTKLFQQLCDRAQSHILKAKWQQKRYADAHRRDAQYNPGNRVWISIRNLQGLNQCSKFEPRFRGPSTVLERTGQVAYRIELPPTYACHNVFHVSQLVPDRLRDPQMKSKEAAVGWLPVTSQDGSPTDIYEVDYILDQRSSGEDVQYIVKWRGAREDRAIWEPAANLTNCPALLRAWRCHLRRARNAQRGLQDAALGSADTASASASSPTSLSPGGEGVERHPPAAAPLIAEDSLKEPARHIYS